MAQNKRAYRVTQEILADSLQVGDGRAGEQAPHDLAVRLHHLWREILHGSHVVMCDDLTPVQRWPTKKIVNELRHEEIAPYSIKHVDGAKESDADKINEYVEGMARKVAAYPCVLSEHPRVEVGTSAAKVTVKIRLAYLPLSKGKVPR